MYEKTDTVTLREILAETRKAKEKSKSPGKIIEFKLKIIKLERELAKRV